MAQNIKIRDLKKAVLILLVSGFVNLWPGNAFADEQRIEPPVVIFATLTISRAEIMHFCGIKKTPQNQVSVTVQLDPKVNPFTNQYGETLTVFSGIEETDITNLHLNSDEDVMNHGATLTGVEPLGAAVSSSPQILECTITVAH